MVVLIILAAGAGGVWYQRQNKDRDGNTILLSPLPTTPLSGALLGTYYDHSRGLAFSYNPQVFTASETADGALLMSPYYVDDNPSGDPKNARQHRFSITIEFAPSDMLSYFKTVPYGSSFSTLFPDGTPGSFTPSEGYAEKTLVGQKTAYRFTLGIEGTNTDYYFVPLPQNKTAIITVSSFTDFLKDGVKPKPFSETEEKTAVTTVLESLQL